MSEQQNRSEVARLRAQIEAEHQSCVLALKGLSSGNLQHAFISSRMRHMDQSYQELENIIGEEQATDILCEVFNTTPNRLVTDGHTSTHPCCLDELLPPCGQKPSYDAYQAHHGGLLVDAEVKRILQNFTKE